MARISGQNTRPPDRGPGLYGIGMLQRNDYYNSMMDNAASSAAVNDAHDSIHV